MLVLTRQVGKKILIGENIWVTVLSVRGKKVRLGFTAPNDVPIHREEFYRRISEEGIGESIQPSGELEVLYS